MEELAFVAFLFSIWMWPFIGAVVGFFAGRKHERGGTGAAVGLLCGSGLTALFYFVLVPALNQAVGPM